jgi:bifunctional non-homologous end joining protein LigD
MDGLSAVAKTSGALGLHLYVGLRPGETFARTRAFARALAAILVAERPAKVTDAFTHAARAGRVLVDWRQNERGRSQVAPYSLRATPWPRVSTPIAWEEIASAASTTEVLLYFSPREVIERLGRSGDLFGSVLDRAHRLPPMRAARDQSVS